MDVNVRKCKESGPDDSSKSSTDERKSLHTGENVRSGATTAHLSSRLNISAQYISSAALTGLLTLSVSVCTTVTRYDYKTVNSSTDSTV